MYIASSCCTTLLTTIDEECGASLLSILFVEAVVKDVADVRVDFLIISFLLLFDGTLLDDGGDTSGGDTCCFPSSSSNEFMAASHSE